MFIFSSCERKSGKRVRGITIENVSDTTIFSPERIAVTELSEHFIPYPKYDGGTGMHVSFSIGIQFKGKIYQVDLSGSDFFNEDVSKEKAIEGKNTSSPILTYYLVANTPKDDIDVSTVKGEVVKISRRGKFFPDGSFYKERIIWEKK